MNTELIARAREMKEKYDSQKGGSMTSALLGNLADALEAAQPAPQVPMTEDEIQDAVTKAVRAGQLSWLGFKKDADGKFTIPLLSLSDYRLIRVAEAHYGIGIKP